MSRIVAVVALTAVVAVLPSARATDGAGATLRPRLEFVQLYPLAVRGTGFRGRERVRVTLGGSRRAAATVVADRRGRFVVRFAVRVPACGSAFVRAVGSAGSRATRELARPDCVEP